MHENMKSCCILKENAKQEICKTTTDENNKKT